MSFNIDSVSTLRSTLTVTRANLKAIRAMELPECHPFERPMKFGKRSGKAKIREFDWSGEASGWRFDDTLPKVVALLEGEADLIFFWEGGAAVGGLKIRDGKMRQVEVKMVLAD